MRKVIKKVLLKDRVEFDAKIEEDLELEFSPIMWMHDRVYVPGNYEKGKNYPRLVMRTTMLSVDGLPRYSVILKRHIEESGVDVANETAVADYMEAVNIIHQLGFVKKSEISRKRQSVVMDEDTMLYVDTIEGVEGHFAKLEKKLETDEKVGETMKDIVKTFETLEETNFVENAYFEIEK